MVLSVPLVEGARVLLRRVFTVKSELANPHRALVPRLDVSEDVPLVST